MSSETSTDEKRSAALEPWQLFTFAGLISAAIVAFFAGAQAPSARVFLILTIFAAAAIGVGALRTFGPLTGVGRQESRTPPGERARARLEREKALALRSLKELEFDRAMGKVSDKDFDTMSARLRVRAGRILRELDAGEQSSYRTAIEQELSRRLGGAAPPATVDATTPPATVVPASPVCAACGTACDADARFCKGCGARLEAV